MTRRRLPIGIQTFGTIRETDSYYVDKTPWIGRLVDEGTHYFLSRPRRFGKSLLLDTMKELFEGNEALFRGLAIHDLVGLVGAPHSGEAQLRQSAISAEPGQVEGQRSRSNSAGPRSARRLDSLARVRDACRARFAFRHARPGAASQKSGRRVVVLVDEYDKPILDPLFAGPGETGGDPRGAGQARANRDFLRGLYAVIKDADAHIRFSFLTGVSKFSKVSLFSGLNNLKDITLDPRYASICGYTDADLDTVFAPELPGLDREKIRSWYNGYNWDGTETLYNPFGVLLLFDTRRFRAHWFETASPRFLIESLFRRRVAAPRLDRMVGSEDLLSAFDVEHIGTEALLFQTGYLTIRDQETVGNRVLYGLGYPNLEVRQSLNEHLLRRLDPDAGRIEANRTRLHRLLEAGDVAGMEELFRAFFAGIPHQWFTRNDIADYEGYYASVFYSYFAGLGAEVAVEDSTNLGRLDMAVRYAGRTWLFEFKVIEQSGAGAALAQLRERRYADKYRGRGEPVHLVGVEFSSADRNIRRFEAGEA